MYPLEQVPFFPFTLYLLHPSAKLKSRFVDLLNAVFDNVHGRFHDHYFRDIGGQYIFCTKSKRKKQIKTFRLHDITKKKKTSSIWIDTLKKCSAKVIVQRTLCSNIQMCLYSRGVEYYLTMLILSYDTWNNTIMRGHDAKHLSDINGSKRLRFDDPLVVCVTNSWKNTVLHWQFSFTNDV